MNRRGNHNGGVILECFHVINDLLEQCLCMSCEASLRFEFEVIYLDPISGMVSQAVLVIAANQARNLAGDIAIAAQQRSVKSLTNVDERLMGRPVIGSRPCALSRALSLDSLGLTTSHLSIGL